MSRLTMSKVSPPTPLSGATTGGRRNITNNLHHPMRALQPRVVGSSNRRSRQSCLTVTAAAKAKFGSFQDLVSQSDIVLVDFYAKWCGPCQMMGQIMEEANKAMKGVKLVKIDTEKYPALASQFQVTALPTLVLFKKGKAVARMEGVLSAPDLMRWVDQQAQRARAG